MNRQNVIKWRVVLAAVLTVGVLLALVIGSLGEARRNDRVMEQLHRIEGIEANLSETVLKLRFGLTGNYDGLNRSLAGIRAARAVLTSPEMGFATDQGEVARAFKAYVRAQDEYEDLVERFKSSNAQLKNSMYHFPSALVEFRGKLPQTPEGRVLDEDLDQLFYDVLRYGTGGDERFAGLISSRVARLRAGLSSLPSADTHRELENVLAHAGLILKQRPVLDALTDRIVYPTVRQDLNRLMTAFQSLSIARDQRADVYRLTLGIVAALLFLAAASSFIRLLRNSRLIERNHRLLECISENIGEGVLATDREGRVIFANLEALRLTGWSGMDLLGQDMHDTLHANPDGSRHTRDQCEVRQCQERGAVCHSDSEHFVRQDGSVFPVDLTNVPIAGDGDVGAVTVFRNISEARERERELRLAASVFENSPYAITITDPGATILRVNPAFCQITGYSESEVVGVNPRILQSGLHDRAFYQRFWNTLLETGQWKGELRNRRRNGDIYPEWLNIRAVKDAGNRVTHYVAIFSDLSEHKEAERRLEYLSNYDTLTGLPNRVLFMDRLGRAVTRARRGERVMALMFLDVDRFKVVNDSLGHAAGDLLLKSMSRRLLDHIRESDTLSRVSGDQFSILLEAVASVADVASKAEDLLQTFVQPFEIEGHEIFSTVSIGITLCPLDGADPETLLKNADAAMFRAKEKGRNNFQFFSADMTAGVYEAMRMENSLRRALEKGELELHYQPQLDLRERSVVGVEALLRWHSGEFGTVMPTHFIPLAEKSGLIVPIGEWVLRTACAQAKTWQEAGFGPMKVAVNLSAVQFRQSDLVEQIRAILRETGLDGQHLELEITESVVMEDVEATIGTLLRLKELGCEISIDDFGTGYSSLSYLKRFPVDTLKIDQSFVEGLGTDSDDTAVVNAVISLGESLSLKLVAEGVETQQQMAYLVERPGDARIAVQGFYFSRPMSGGEMTTFLETGTTDSRLGA